MERISTNAVNKTEAKARIVFSLIIFCPLSFQGNAPSPMFGGMSSEGILKMLRICLPPQKRKYRNGL